MSADRVKDRWKDLDDGRMDGSLMIFTVYFYYRDEDGDGEPRYRRLTQVGAETDRQALEFARELYPQYRKTDPTRYPLGQLVVRPGEDRSGMPGMRLRRLKGIER